MIKHQHTSSQHETELSFSSKQFPSGVSFPFSPGGAAQSSERDERASTKSPLPCLYNNNSIESFPSTSHVDNEEYIIALSQLLSSYHKRQAQTLYSNVDRLITKVAKSVNHVGFLTLTFPDNVTDHKEASRRFNSLKTNFLSKYPEFGEWICVKEQQKRGAWHYHMLICLEQDIKTGFNFDEIENHNYKSASQYLRKIWNDLREAMPKYKFGRSELLPIKSNAEAMARYVGKYISKHITQREENNKGVRLISSSQGWAKNSVHFAWNTKNSKEWRMKLKYFAMMNGCSEMYQLTEKLGAGWPYRHFQDIYNVFAESDKIVANKEREYQPEIVKNIVSRQKKREKYLMENLLIHTRPSAYNKKIEESKLLNNMIIQQSHIEKWIRRKENEND